MSFDASHFLALMLASGRGAGGKSKAAKKQKKQYKNW